MSLDFLQSRIQTSRGKCYTLSNGDAPWTGVPLYNLTDILVHIDDRNWGDKEWKSVDCIAGYFPIPNGFGSNPKKYRMPWEFSKSSKSLLVKAKRSVLPEGKEYLVVHWRRGDQLRESHRCAGRATGGPDSSVNCKTSKEFIREVLRLNYQYKIPSGTKVYVATNENNETEIASLRNAGLITFRDVENYKWYSLFDIFMIELQLMCEAKYFFGFGKYNTNIVLNFKLSEYFVI
jgi:hypothetical protein